VSIISAICADHHLQIVKNAIDGAKAKATTEEAKTLLDEVLRYCQERISE